MIYQGNLRKMSNVLTNPIEYSLVVDDEVIAINKAIGKDLKLKFLGEINCIACNRLIKKTYNQGYCFPCTRTLASCDLCILKPSLCHYHKGTCREPQWGKGHCFVAHIVYLANSSGLKVGITRETQIPTRWIDQGAVQALPVFRVQSRYQSGLIEEEARKYMADKTNWRKMLQGNIEPIDLVAERDNLFSNISAKIQEISKNFELGSIELLTNEKTTSLSYPVMTYPDKVKSLSFDKTLEINGKLMGVKGQYLIFEHGVLNIRRFTSYKVAIEF
jgi:hypothetical protein